MRQFLAGLVFTLLLVTSVRAQNLDTILYQSESLTIKQISPNGYVHISDIHIPDYGSFPCNGLVYVNQQQAVVFDTPLEDSISAELIEWIENNLTATIKAIVINHFHTDCLGGLAEFHHRDIPSYANNLTLELAKHKPVVPQHGFDDTLRLAVGQAEVINRFLGEAHTADNIVSYIPEDDLLFGGCMVKEVGAGEGNLEDANVLDWPTTIQKIKQTFPSLKIVIPGHGQAGGTELLDYTIELFEKK
ncbi:MAG: subclass B1 metallo-beta-lactamase [Bacteroidota bacterium]